MSKPNNKQIDALVEHERAHADARGHWESGPRDDAALYSLARQLLNYVMADEVKEKIVSGNTNSNHITFWIKDGVLNFRVSNGTTGTQPYTRDPQLTAQYCTRLMEAYHCATQEWIS